MPAKRTTKGAAAKRGSLSAKASAATREAILKAAEHEFATRGFGGARAETIAQRAHVNKALPFYHFGSKAQLYTEVLNRILGRLGDLVATSISTSSDYDQRTRLFIEGFSAYLAADPNVLKIMVRELIDQGSRATMIARRYLRPLFEAGRAEIANSIAKGQVRALDPDQIMISIGAEVAFYFLLAPFLHEVGIRNPLSADKRARRVDAVLSILDSGLRPV